MEIPRLIVFAPTEVSASNFPYEVKLSGKASAKTGIDFVTVGLDPNPTMLAQHDALKGWEEWVATVKLPEPGINTIYVLAKGKNIGAVMVKKKVVALPRIDKLSTNFPALLFPVRLEVRRLADKKIWLRVFPDQAQMDVLDRRLTVDELKAGALFYQKPVQEKKKAWDALIEKYGVKRAAWILRAIPNPLTDLADIEFKYEDEKSALLKPRFRGLPSRFRAIVYKDGAIIYQKDFKDIPVGLDFLGGEGQNFSLDPNQSEWLLTDLKKAEGQGLAVCLDGLPSGLDLIDRIIVTGLLETSEEWSRTVLEDMLEAHHYSSGMSFVEYGTPSNNTEEKDSGFVKNESNAEDAYQIEVEGEPGWSSASWGAQVASALGLKDKPYLFRYLKNASKSESEESKSMRQAFIHRFSFELNRGLFQNVFNETDKNEVSKFFQFHVDANGYLPILRIGNQPYGIIPTKRTDFFWIDRSVVSSNTISGFVRDSNGHAQKDISIWLKSVEKWTKTDVKGYFTFSNLNGKMYTLLVEAAGKKIEIPNVEPGKGQVMITLQNDAFQHRLRDVLFRLKNRWSDITEDKWRVPRIAPDRYPQQQVFWGFDGAVNADLEQVMKMEPVSKGFRVRPLLADWAWNYLLKYLRSCEFEGTASFGGQPPAQWFNNKFIQWQHSLGDPKLQPIADALKKSREWMSLKKGGSSIECDWLPTTLIGNIEGDENLVLDKWMKEVWGDIFAINWTYNDVLSSFPDFKWCPLAERIAWQTFDLLSHRLDAWISGLAAQRLAEIRKQEKSKHGIYLGAYGWLEHLKFVKSEASEEGYIHAPSMPQAEAACILRNAHRNYRNNKNENNPFRINLDSERVRQADFILEGIRQGQNLENLLGYQFERDLHEANLDRYIDEFREVGHNFKTFQLISTAIADETVTRSVVDGVSLTNWWTKFKPIENTPVKLRSTLNFLDNASDKDLLTLSAILDRLCGAYDALGDCLQYEAMYQTVQGNFERSKAALETISGTAYPPELESLKTPVTGKTLSHRVALLFPKDVEKPASSFLNPRAKVEPRFASWIENILGNPKQIGCTASYQTIPSSSGSAKTVIENIWLQKGQPDTPGLSLQLDVVDLFYLSSRSSEEGQSEIEKRIEHVVRSARNLPIGVKIQINLSPSNMPKPLGDAVWLSRQIHKLLTKSKWLHPRILRHGSEAVDSYFTQNEQANFYTRVYLILNELVKIRSKLADQKDATAIFNSLLAVSLYNVNGVFPEATDVTSLNNQKSLAAREMDKRIRDCRQKLDTWDKLEKEKIAKNETPDWDTAMEMYAGAMQSLFGLDFMFLPVFNPMVPSGAASLSEFFNPVPNTLLANNSESRIRFWMQEAAPTHPQLREIETLFQATDAWNTAPGGQPATVSSVGRLSVSQLPYSKEQRWLGLSDDEIKEGNKPERKNGQVSIVTLCPSWQASPDYSTLSGLLLDQWEEWIPNPEQTTGIGFQYNAPNSQPPQAMLLAMASCANQNWSTDELAAIVNDTLDLAILRTVDSEAILGDSEHPYMYAIGSLAPLSVLDCRMTDISEWARNASETAMQRWMANNLSNNNAWFFQPRFYEASQASVWEQRPGTQPKTQINVGGQLIKFVENTLKTCKLNLSDKTGAAVDEKPMNALGLNFLGEWGITFQNEKPNWFRINVAWRKVTSLITARNKFNEMTKNIRGQVDKENTDKTPLMEIRDSAYQVEIPSDNGTQTEKVPVFSILIRFIDYKPISKLEKINLTKDALITHIGW